MKSFEGQTNANRMSNIGSWTTRGATSAACVDGSVLLESYVSLRNFHTGGHLSLCCILTYQKQATCITLWSVATLRDAFESNFTSISRSPSFPQQNGGTVEDTF